MCNTNNPDLQSKQPQKKNNEYTPTNMEVEPPPFVKESSLPKTIFHFHVMCASECNIFTSPE